MHILRFNWQKIASLKWNTTSLYWAPIIKIYPILISIDNSILIAIHTFFKLYIYLSIVFLETSLKTKFPKLQFFFWRAFGIDFPKMSQDQHYSYKLFLLIFSLSLLYNCNCLTKSNILFLFFSLFERVTNRGTSFQGDGEESAGGQTARLPRSYYDHCQISSQRSADPVHWQAYPRARVHSTPDIRAFLYQRIAAVREQQQLAQAARYVKHENETSRWWWICLLTISFLMNRILFPFNDNFSGFFYLCNISGINRGKERYFNFTQYG